MTIERPRILLCDDDTEFLKSVQLGLRSSFDVHTANTVVQGKMLAAKYEYDAAIIDLNFEGQDLDGIHLLDHLGKKAPGTYLIVLSGDDSVKRVVAAMRRKLFEFVHKEGDFFPILQESLTRVVQLKRSRSSQSAERYLTESPKVKDLLKTAERIVASPSEAPILILGETGSGKEFLARHIAHSLKLRLVAVNMGAIPKETAESVLFGHEKGAFTGAITNKIGLIESANGGLFFMDEIGECTPPIQTKLLRILQEREVQPVGSVTSRKVKTRFIAATHQNLGSMVQEGGFRNDLLQRLNAFTLRLPPLRERPEDILFYANLFAEEFSEGSVRYSITPSGAQELLAYAWPGNIRELKNVIQRVVVLSGKTVIDAQAVLDAIDLGQDQDLARRPQKPIEVLEGNLKRDQLLAALEKTGGNKRLAAKSLSISEATVYRWIQDFGLTRLIQESFRSTHSASTQEVVR